MFDREQIKMGMKSEKEHRKSKAETLGIVEDHLKEIPDYYTRLNKMEAEAPKTNFNSEKDKMENPIMASLKKRKKKEPEQGETKQHEASESKQFENEEDTGTGAGGAEEAKEKKMEFIKKLIALKKKK